MKILFLYVDLYLLQCSSYACLYIYSLWAIAHYKLSCWYLLFGNNTLTISDDWHIPLLHVLCRLSAPVQILVNICIHYLLGNILLFIEGNVKNHFTSGAKHPNWRCQFCSNLTKIASFLVDIELRKPHMDLLQITPLYQFLMPFISKNVNLDHIKATKGGLIKILITCNKEVEAFVLGGKHLNITAS